MGDTKFRSRGYNVRLVSGVYDPDDNSFGDTGYASRPNARAAWSASIDNRFYHETTLYPFDSADEARKAASKWTAERAKHALFS